MPKSAKTLIFTRSKPEVTGNLSGWVEPHGQEVHAQPVWSKSVKRCRNAGSLWVCVWICPSSFFDGRMDEGQTDGQTDMPVEMK